MSEPEQAIVESASSVSTEPENVPTELSTSTENSTSAEAPVVEERKPSSSWLNNLGLSPNLTSQLTNLSSSIMQATSKVTAAANTLVQKTLPQRPSSPNDNEQTEIKHEEEQQHVEQTSEENTGTAGANKDKDLTSMYFLSLSM
jgi:hypothetical protein